MLAKPFCVSKLQPYCRPYFTSTPMSLDVFESSWETPGYTRNPR